MKNGYLVVAVNCLIEGLVWLNFDELLKKIAVRLPPSVVDAGEVALRKRCNPVIDSFIVAKWLFIVLAFLNGWSNDAVFWITWYLLATNVFGYFYHHAWVNSSRQDNDDERQQRRFMNLLLAIGFYLMCYANLYLNFYPCDIGWPEGFENKTDAIYLSIANAFTLTYGDFSALTQTARVLFMSELITTFIMLAIVLASSIPDYSERG